VHILAGPGGGIVNMNKVIGFTVFTGHSGNDTVNIGAGNLDINLGSQVNVTGNGGFDSVFIDDRLDTGNDTYGFFASNVFQKSRAGGGNSPLIIVSVESQILSANDDSNVITVEGGYTTPLSLFANGGDDTVDVMDGTVTLNTGSGADSLIVNGDFGPPSDAPATVIINSDEDLNNLTVATGGSVLINSGAVLAKNAGTFTVEGVIDLADGAMIARGDVPPTVLRNLIIRGRNAGAWNGTGGGSGALNSSLAASTPFSDGVGYGLGSDIAVASIGSFSIAPTDSLIRYTRDGDANLDGMVTLADFNRLASSFGVAGRIWTQGDFNYDGLVSLIDFNVLAANFGQSASSTGASSKASSAEDLDAVRAELPELD
jgi:hypothetical protein